MPVDVHALTFIVMVFKTHFSKNSLGTTLLELMIAVLMLLVLLASSLLILDPIGSKKRANDNKRLSDISILERAVNEYRIDNNAYPDTVSTLRQSDVLAVNGSNLAISTGGWIAANLSNYVTKQPVDPINTSNYVYKYIHNSKSYEINCVLEDSLTTMQNDGGNNAAVYEVGNNLTLIP